MLLTAARVFAFAGVASADQGTGACVQATHDAVIAFYDEGGGDETPTFVGNPDTYTLGDAISAGFYGNTSNPNEDGKPGITPSLSPGPKVLNDDGEVIQGSSIGDFNQAFGPAGKNCSRLP